MEAPTEIVDAHVHLLDPGTLDYPWIEQPRPQLRALLDNYYDIAGGYGVEALRADLEAEPVRATVACEFGAADGVAEATWVQGQSDRHGWPDAFIAAVDLTAPDLGDTLARYAELPVVRAVRQPLYWSADPLRRLGARPDFLADPQWRRGFERVAERGLTWDLLVYDEQIAAAEPLIRAYPQTRFVLEATGWPLDLTPEGYARWRERLQRLGSLPNVVLKLQGLALIFGPSGAAVGPWVREAVAIFGAGRCMFASHFPVDRLLWPYSTLVRTLHEVLARLTPEERHDFFAGTALGTYGVQATGRSRGAGQRRD